MELIVVYDSYNHTLTFFDSLANFPVTTSEKERQFETKRQILSVLARSFWKLNFSRSATFYLKTRVCLKYFENDWSLFVIASLVCFSYSMHPRHHCVKRVHILCYSVLYSLRMRKNTDPNNSECGHFSRSGCDINKRNIFQNKIFDRIYFKFI